MTTIEFMRNCNLDDLGTYTIQLIIGNANLQIIIQINISYKLIIYDQHYLLGKCNSNV